MEKDSQIKKKALVIHSGGMDSSLCLALAIEEFGRENVLSLSFRYSQRHNIELVQAEKICRHWNVDHTIVNIESLAEITVNALTNQTIPIEHLSGQSPNTLVTGRNGLMARLGAIHADHLGATCIYMGVMELEEANSGYRDCSRGYMDLMEKILRIDLDNSAFQIRTPLVDMTKKETMELGHKLGVLSYLLEETITCYEGIPLLGCKICPACLLRNEGIKAFSEENHSIDLPTAYQQSDLYKVFA